MRWAGGGDVVDVRKYEGGVRTFDAQLLLTTEHRSID